MAVSPKFAAFDLVDVEYKRVHGVGIPASILIPKDIQPGKHPLLVRWHGGCLITGHRLYPDWFANWILDLAKTRDAIIVTPDYRLLPEVSAKEILDDVRDFFNWLTTPGNIDAHLPKNGSADIDHILVTGESAGGWLSLQSALQDGYRDKIAAVITQYPMIDMRDRYWTEDYHKDIFTPTAPQLDRSILKDYMGNMKKGETITCAIPPDRVPVVISALQQGAFGEMFGDDASLYPLEALEKVQNLPPIWLIHGEKDTVVPIEGSHKFVEAVMAKGDVKLFVTYESGDHGFDNEEGVSLETDWVNKGVEFVDKYWPSQS